MRTLIVLFLVLPFTFYAQEFDCFNQIDDDGDGLIDMVDPDCSCFLFNEVGDSELTTSPPIGNSGQYCFDITDATNSQLGAIWLENKVDLNNDFAFRAEIYAGDNDGGADGFAIVFHNDPAGVNALGLDGVNLGFGGYDTFWGTYNSADAISPSVAFEIDTYDNGVSQGDVSADHIAISLNGDVYNAISTPATTALPNIEDGNYHDVLIEWDSSTQTFYFEIDGTYSTAYTADVINTVFSGENLVNFGFTGSTGGYNNQQTICITGLDLPSAGESGAIQICNGTPNVFNLFDYLGGAPSTIGTWEDPSGNAFDSSHLGAFDLSNDPLGVYTYIVENNSGCITPFATVDVTSNTTTYTLESTNNTACDVSNGSLLFSDLLPNTNYELTYEWEGEQIGLPLGFTSDALGNHSIDNLSSGEYTNIILNNQGCLSQPKMTSILNPCEIPNGISPNNDGLNDCFDVDWLQATNIQVFNRYGVKIYEKKDYRNEWCGTTKDGNGGETLVTGTYYYVLNLPSGKPITGWVYVNNQQ